MPTVEVLRPARQVRQMRGKSDQIDACAAAHTALADVYTFTAKTSTGIVEAIRVTSTARRSGVKARGGAALLWRPLRLGAGRPLAEEATPEVAAQVRSRAAREGVKPVAPTLPRAVVRGRRIRAETARGRARGCDRRV